MRLKIVTTTTIDADSGQITSTSTWHVEGHDQGLGNPLAQTLARLREKVVTTQADPAAPEAPTPGAAAQVKLIPAARHLATLCGISSEDLQAALDTRPAVRVVEVLRWIKDRRTKTPIKNATALFWSVVAKD